MTETDDYSRDYFEHQGSSNEQFWARFGGAPDFAGRRVLEVGCGHGALSVSAAEQGASVLGVDLDPGRIDFANRHVREQFPELSERVTFRCVDVADLPRADEFDLALSKDTFEHVEDLPALLSAVHRMLKPGGLLYAGFSPLYFSPYGDHGRTGLRVPWAHAILPQRLVLAAASHHQQHRVSSLADLGLNGWTPRQFLEAFDDSPFAVVRLGYNRGDKRLLAVLNRARRIAALERLATVSIYAVLRAADNASTEATNPA